MILKSVQCDPACGFMVRSHSAREVVDVVLKHAKEGAQDEPHRKRCERHDEDGKNEGKEEIKEQELMTMRQ